MKPQIGLARLLFLVWALLIVTPLASAREIPAIVSTDWLEKNLANPRLVVLDIRKVEAYREGHIPGAVNAFYSAWAFRKKDLDQEVPDPDVLVESIGHAGIGSESLVVIVCNMDTQQEQVQAARVACTFQYAGIREVAILDGGHKQWVIENRRLSDQWVIRHPGTFAGKINPDLLIKGDALMSRLGKALLVDVRDPSYFEGGKKQAFVQRAGRIPGAINLPSSWAFQKDNTFKSREELEKLVTPLIGSDRNREIVTYCDAGKCCPTWSFLLREVLGYRNVRIYDGSMQEWTENPSHPVDRSPGSP